ncbi:RNA-directed DNA polymerase (Reverse transcriptase), partial [Trifolium medium]|nr:RNA-directed DNA polymerase (Reverse transcriptase) [Trifolium medium]
MINSFWWGSNKTSGRGMNWLRWEKLAMRKEHGGMGFRHMYDFNLAMLGKQGWKLLTNHDTILSQVFKAKYYPQQEFLDAKLGHNPSYVWRSIHASQVIVRKGLRWWIWNGTNVYVWNQPLLRNDEQPLITSDVVAGNEHMTVADLIDYSTRTWNHQLLHQTFNARDVDDIVKIPLNLLHTNDEIIWNCSRNGIYSVRSAYYQLTQ